MSPLKKLWTILLVYSGNILDRTEITPAPPRESTGSIWSSFPEYIAISSPHKLEICATCEIFPRSFFYCNNIPYLCKFKTGLR